MDETNRRSEMRFDWFGFVALAVGIGSLQMMLDRGEQVGWFEIGRDRCRTGRVGRGLLFLPGAFADDSEPSCASSCSRIAISSPAACSWW